MRRRDFGLSNAYLKIGLVLVVASLAAIAWMSCFAAGAGRQGVAGAAWGVALLAGVVVYAIGRVVRARGPCGAAPDTRQPAFPAQRMAGAGQARGTDFVMPWA